LNVELLRSKPLPVDEMTMGDLDRRLRWLERRGGGGPLPIGIGPRIVTIKGGLPRPLGAMVVGTDWELAALPGETLDGFQHRAWKWADDLGAKFVVISGQAIERLA
jgi:hypothetical protein